HDPHRRPALDLRHRRRYHRGESQAPRRYPAAREADRIPLIMSRELFGRAALDLIPKILTLQDRNAHSPTYGCFDRNFWHYKIIDFPSGILQEAVCVPALGDSLSAAGNT